MLPHVHGQDRGLAIHPGVLGIRGLGDLELARAISGQPSPARAELCGTSGLECILECIERPKVALDGVTEGTGGLSALVRAHRLPEESMVDNLGSVVELRGGFSAVPGLEHDLLNGELLEISALDLAIQVVKVSSMVLAIVELESGL